MIPKWPQKSSLTVLMEAESFPLPGTMIRSLTKSLLTLWRHLRKEKVGFRGDTCNTFLPVIWTVSLIRVFSPVVESCQSLLNSGVVAVNPKP